MMPLSSAGSLDCQHQVNTVMHTRDSWCHQTYHVKSYFHLVFPVVDVVSFLDSSYERPSRTVHLTNVMCSGNEESINACTKTLIPLAVGKTTYRNSSVVAIDCSPEPPTEPICLPKQGMVIPAPSCSPEGSVRLVDGHMSNEGRLEFCYTRKWSPFCTLDFNAASVACNQLGYTQYAGTEKWVSFVFV